MASFPLRWRLCRVWCLGLLALLPRAADAAALATEPYAWRNVVIKGGGLVTGLLYHPAERDLLYARTDVGGVYRWEPAARQWVPLNDGIGRSDVELLGVASFAVDPRDSQRLYLAAGSYVQEWGKPAALLWSDDRGTTWQRVPLPFKLGGNADGRTTGERLQVDPRDSRILLLGTNHDGLWRSDDRGLSWKRVSSFPRPDLSLVFFAPGRAEPAPSPIIYGGVADTAGPALYRSTDAGATWSPVPGQPAGLIIHHAGFDADGALYLAYANALGPNGITDGAVWKLTPATDNWVNITPVRPQPAGDDAFGYAGLAVDARHPGTLMVSTLDRWKRHDEIFRSTDGGATWKPLLASSTWDHSPAPYMRELNPHWIGQIALNPSDPEQAWFITGYGLWETARASAADSGILTSWTIASDGLEETVIEDLVSPPEGAPLVSALSDFAGFRHDDLLASPPAGTHQPMHSGNPGLAFAEHAPAKMVRTHGGPARGALSIDGGRTWQDFPTAPPTARTGPGKIALSADGRRLVWLPKDSAPYFSADDGATWVNSRGGPVSPKDYRTIAPVADRVNAAKFYIHDLVTGWIYVSQDGGESFKSTVKLPPKGGTLVAEPGRDGGVWVPTPAGLYFSDDSGKSFVRLPLVQEAYQVGFGRAAPGRANATLYLAGRIDGRDGIFRSDDSGRTWVVLNDPRRHFGWLRVITGDPRIYGRVYLGTSGRGIVYGEPAPR